MGKKSAPKDEALGGGLGLVNGMLGDLQKEFERSMKDSEDVMETLEVTSLAELKDKTEQIATSNKANAKAALEKATATASSGKWVSPTSGDPLLMKPKPDAQALKKREKERERERKRREKEEKKRGSKKTPDPGPLDALLKNEAVAALQRAASRAPAEEPPPKGKPTKAAKQGKATKAARRPVTRGAPPPPPPGPHPPPPPGGD
jgi:hypothetical protein